jgi:hypothetical protein
MNIPTGDEEAAMFTAAECRAIAKQKLTLAEHDDRHRRRLTYAAEAWLFLANRLSGEETAFSNRNVVKKIGSKKRERGNAASAS